MANATQQQKAPRGLYIPTSFTEFAELVPGIPCGTLSCFFGAPKAGKSTIVFQLGAEAAQQLGGNLLIVDTELGQHTHDALAKGMSGRLGDKVNLVPVTAKITREGRKDDPKWVTEFEVEGKPEKDAVNVFVLTCPDIRDLLIIFGRGMELDISAGSGKGKAILVAGAYVAHIEDSPIFKFCKEQGIAAAVVDSITNPLDEMPAVGENFPARADFTQAWLIQMQKLAVRLRIPILAIAHESKNEASAMMGNMQLKLEGGKGVGYNVKFVFYLMKEKNNALLPPGSPLKGKLMPLPSNGRYLIVDRAPGKPDWTLYKAVQLTDEGFKGLKQNGADEDTTTQEA